MSERLYEPDDYNGVMSAFNFVRSASRIHFWRHPESGWTVNTAVRRIEATVPFGSGWDGEITVNWNRAVPPAVVMMILNGLGDIADEEKERR